MPALQRHRINEEILAHRTLQSFLHGPHSSVYRCYGGSVCTVLLTVLLINVSQVCPGMHKRHSRGFSVTLLKTVCFGFLLH